jgi:murein DD-endopeptidase MepM/ murein hydrolase activator NlpD
MIRISSPVAMLAVAGVCLATPVLAASPEEERLLGCGCEEAQLQSYLPFTRAIGTSGGVSGSLAESAVQAGVPRTAVLELVKALGGTIDLDRDVHDGDRFYVRYERAFTAAGDPIEVGRLLWAEIKTAAKGTLILHRFRPAGAVQDTFWLANGEATSPPVLEMPLKTIVVTSGFGMRADPMDQPWGHKLAAGPAPPKGRAGGGRWQAPPAALAPSPLLTGAASVNQPTSLGLSLGLAPAGTQRFFGFGPGHPGGRVMEMHDGVDLVAAVGTPVYAAGDGVVLGAEAKGGYGNWIEIEHPGKLATIYGHLSAFAPGIVAGAHVNQGDLIGYTGNTGRSTGPHLHFEIRVNGRATNPIGNAALKHAQLRGADLVNFRKVMARDRAEQEREARSM